MKLVENNLRSLAKDFLFENDIKESYLPDDFRNSRSDMYSNTAGSNDEVEDTIEVPLSADDFVSLSTLTVKRNHSARDDSYSPENKSELKSALVSLVDDFDNEEINNNVAEKVWNAVTDILGKIGK